MEIKEKLNADYAISVDQVEIIAWIDLLTNTKAQEKEEAFLKVRAHFLQRITHGLWSCINPHCNQKEGTSLKNGHTVMYMQHANKNVNVGHQY